MKQLYELYRYSCATRQYTYPITVVTLDTALYASIKELVLVEDASETSTTATFNGFNNHDIDLGYVDFWGDECFETYSIKPIDMRYIV